MGRDRFQEIQDEFDTVAGGLRSQVRELADSVRAFQDGLELAGRVSEMQLAEIRTAMEALQAEFVERLDAIEVVLGSLVRRIERLESERKSQ